MGITLPGPTAGTAVPGPPGSTAFPGPPAGITLFGPPGSTALSELLAAVTQRLLRRYFYNPDNEIIVPITETDAATEAPIPPIRTPYAGIEPKS